MKKDVEMIFCAIQQSECRKQWCKDNIKCDLQCNPTSAQQTIESREATHGDYGKQSALSQALKCEMRVPEWDELPADVRETLDMTMVKVSRIIHGSLDPDHFLDIQGYQQLILNRLTKGTHL